VQRAADSFKRKHLRIFNEQEAKLHALRSDLRDQCVAASKQELDTVRTMTVDFDLETSIEHNESVHSLHLHLGNNSIVSIEAAPGRNFHVGHGDFAVLSKAHLDESDVTVDKRLALKEIKMD